MLMNKPFVLWNLFEKKTIKGVPKKEENLDENPNGYHIFGQNIKYQYAHRVLMDEKYLQVVEPDKPILAYTSSVGEIGMITESFYRTGDNGAFQGLFPKMDIDIKSMMYLLTVLRKHFTDFDYSTSMKNIMDLCFELPVIENSNPDHEYTVDDIDWQYMRDRITELERDRITELDAYLQATGLNDYELTEEDKKILFKKVEFTDILIGKLFNKVEAKCKKADFDKRKDTSSLPTNEFCIPLINAKLGDNGIMFYGRKEDWNTQSMCIDVIQNGAVATGKVYVQPQATAVLWDAYLIQPTFDDVTEHSLLYLSRCIEKLTKERFSYEKKATWDRIKECFITIPIKSDGTPDFDYMERYIRAIEKIVIADVVKYKDKVIETTKKVAGE